MDVLTPHMFQLPSESFTDKAVLLERMFAHAQAQGLEDVILDWSGYWQVQSPVHIRGNNCVHVCGHIEATEPFSGPIVTIDANGSTFSGFVRVDGKGSSAYAQRQHECCVELGQVHRSQFDGFVVRTAQRDGVRTRGDSKIIDTQLGLIRASDCGVTDGVNADSIAKVTLSWSNRVDEGADTANTQLSRIDLDYIDQMGLGHVRHLDGLVIDGEFYLIRSLDEASEPGRVGVYPKIKDFSSLDGSAVVVNGAALNLIGGNTTGAQFERISAARCSIGLLDGGLYGGGHNGITTENCTVNWQIGNDTGGTTLGGDIGHIHSESDTFQIVKVTRIDNPRHVASMTTAFWDRMRALTNNGASGPNTEKWAAFNGIIINHVVQYDECRIQGPRNFVPSNTNLVVSNDPKLAQGTIRRDSPTIHVQWDDDVNRLYGYDTAHLFLVGDDMGSPGDVLFQVDDPSHGTVEGQSSVLESFTTPIRVTLVRDVAAGDWRLYTESANGPATP